MPSEDGRQSGSPVSAAAVAREAGVSPATVSYVMNGQPGVSEKTRERVLALAAQMGYTARTGAKLPTPRRSHVVGLVMPNVINPMFPRWAHGIVGRARQTGHEVFLATSQEDPEILESTVRALIARRVDGLILASLSREEVSVLHLLRTARIPYVQLSRRSDFVSADFVGVDDAMAAEAMAGHVIGHGCDEVATVSGPRSSSASAARERGAITGARARGVDIPPARRISTRLDNVGGRLAAQELLNSADLPQAIICGSDELAIGVMEQLIKCGVRIPEDVLVTGFDGLPHSRSELVGLTTVIQPQIEMAETAFDLLQERIDRPSAPFQSVLMPHELWIGRTCGCPSESRSTNPPDTDRPEAEEHS